MALRTVERSTPIANPGTCGLSLVMIARNAEGTIARAIESVDGVCDEVIVYLAGESTDNTADVAARAGATVIPGEWRDDFAWARNQAQKHANGKWVLVMDADEYLHPDDKALLRAALKRPMIYSLRLISTMDEGLDDVEHDSARLFPNLPTIRWHYALHEQPRDDADSLDSDRIPVRIMHTGYTADAMKAQAKCERNLGIIMNMVNEQPHNPQYRLFLAQTFQLSEQHMAAVDQYRMTLHLCRMYPKDRNTEKVFEQAAMGVVSALNHLGHYEAAAGEATHLQGFMSLRHPGYWVCVGNAYNALKMPTDAIVAFERAIGCADNVDLYQCDSGVRTWKPYCGLGYALSLAGRMPEAKAALIRSIDLGAKEPQRSAIEDALTQF